MRLWWWCRRGRGSLGWIQCRNGVLIDYQLVCEKLAVFPYTRYTVEFCVEFPFLWYSLVQDRSGGWREIHVEICSKTNAIRPLQHQCNAPLRGAHMHELHLTVSMLGLCDPSNLLFVLSTEERRALLKLLWGLVYSLFRIKCNGYRVINIKGELVFTCIFGVSNFTR